MYKFWIAAIVITLAAAYYQRITGPTYPVKGKTMVGETEIKYSLPRSAKTESDCEIEIPAGKNTSGVLRYKRFNTNDEWKEYILVSSEGKIKALLPKQPAAGKLVYEISLNDGTNSVKLTEEPLVMRFRNDVPAWAMIPHIIIIFLAMLLSNLTGMLAIKKKPNARRFLFLTVIVLFVGGLIFGPIVQKFAFGDYWTGVPFGWDLTDNKTLIAMLVWLAALIANRRKISYGWLIAASVVMLVVFLIPHSMFGSELDYTTGTVTQG